MTPAFDVIEFYKQRRGTIVLYLVSNGEGRSAFALLLAGWGRKLNQNVRMIDYSRLLSRRKLPIASYIFAGLETLDVSALERVATHYALSEEHRSGYPGSESSSAHVAAIRASSNAL